MFRFHLQRVLDYRIQYEEKKEFELAQARRVMQQEEDRLAFFKERQSHYQEEFLERQKQGMSPAEAAIYLSYEGFLKEKIAWQKEAVEAAVRGVEEKKVELLAARKERKTLELIRSRRYQAFLAESRRRETKDLDEVALTKHQVRVREGQG